MNEDDPAFVLAAARFLARFPIVVSFGRADDASVQLALGNITRFRKLLKITGTQGTVEHFARLDDLTTFLPHVRPPERDAAVILISSRRPPDPALLTSKAVDLDILLDALRFLAGHAAAWIWACYAALREPAHGCDGDDSKGRRRKAGRWFRQIRELLTDDEYRALDYTDLVDHPDIVKQIPIDPEKCVFYEGDDADDLNRKYQYFDEYSVPRPPRVNPLVHEALVNQAAYPAASLSAIEFWKAIEELAPSRIDSANPIPFPVDQLPAAKLTVAPPESYPSAAGAAPWRCPIVPLRLSADCALAFVDLVIGIVRRMERAESKASDVGGVLWTADVAAGSAATQRFYGFLEHARLLAFQLGVNTEPVPRNVPLSGICTWTSQVRLQLQQHASSREESFDNREKAGERFGVSGRTIDDWVRKRKPGIRKDGRKIVVSFDEFEPFYITAMARKSKHLPKVTDSMTNPP